jgi:hypothetical protein
MPAIRIYLDKSLESTVPRLIEEAFPKMREAGCRLFGVAPAICKITIVPSYFDVDIPQANVEVNFLDKPERTKEIIRTLCAELHDILGPYLGFKPAVAAAIRDPETFVLVK